MKTKQNKRANRISINDEIKKKFKVYKINQDENHTKKKQRGLNQISPNIRGHHGFFFLLGQLVF